MLNKTQQMIQNRKFFVFILLLAVFIAGCSNSPSNANSRGANSSEINKNMVPEPIDEKSLVAPVPPENDVNISKENFNKIKNGMSFFEVDMQIAGTYKKITSKTVNGKKTETYLWETNDAAKSIEVTFENEKVIGKKEKGLK